MGILIAILIILMVWIFMISPFVKIYRTTRTIRDAYAEAQRKARQQREHAAEPPKPKKKIDPTVGEYVQFTELTQTRTTTDRAGTTTSEVRESQITDVTWEDM